MFDYENNGATEVLGVPISGLCLNDLLDVAFQRMREHRKTLFSTANAHSIVLAQRLRDFAAHFRQADAVLPDGVSAVWGARACGGGVKSRVCGPDFFEAFLARAAEEQISVFLLGTDDATLQRLSAECRARWPSIIIKGTLAQPFGPLTSADNRRIVEVINTVRPDALFVAMTAPKQELWISEHFNDLNVKFAMGVGAAFDFLSGAKPRAPAIVGRLGVEWLHRLVLEPRRMWRRNVDSVVFLALVAGEVVRRIGRPPRRRA